MWLVPRPADAAFLFSEQMRRRELNQHPAQQLLVGLVHSLRARRLLLLLVVLAVLFAASHFLNAEATENMATPAGSEASVAAAAALAPIALPQCPTSQASKVQRVVSHRGVDEDLTGGPDHNSSTGAPCQMTTLALLTWICFGLPTIRRPIFSLAIRRHYVNCGAWRMRSWRRHALPFSSTLARPPRASSAAQRRCQRCGSRW